MIQIIRETESNIMSDNRKIAYINSIIKYDYTLYNIISNDIIVGYIIEYNIPRSTKRYIDIFVSQVFRCINIGSVALKEFIKYNNNKDICIVCNDRRKIYFLIKNGFKLDEVQIYKNLYKYKRGDNNGNT